MDKKNILISFNGSLNPQDTESKTYGCRANNPDICGNNELPNICAFTSTVKSPLDSKTASQFPC
jgi:hypothetical protein